MQNKLECGCPSHHEHGPGGAADCPICNPARIFYSIDTAKNGDESVTVFATIGTDGVSLLSVAHPRAPWWERLWFWVTGPYVRWRASRYSIEDIEIEPRDNLYASSLYNALTGNFDDGL